MPTFVLKFMSGNAERQRDTIIKWLDQNKTKKPSSTYPLERNYIDLWDD